jgi:hypothetical protein
MASGWSVPIDAYCERIDASFWSEPVNALSNGGFLAAAALAFLQWRRARSSDRPAICLIIIVATVGVGSFLFHTFANRWSRLADVLPIAGFIYGYFFLAMRRYLDCRSRLQARRPSLSRGSASASSALGCWPSDGAGSS